LLKCKNFLIPTVLVAKIWCYMPPRQGGWQQWFSYVPSSCRISRSS